MNAPGRRSPGEGTPRGCLPFVYAGMGVIAVCVGLIILYARQIDIGPFDEEGEPQAVFVVDYRLRFGSADRVQGDGTPITDLASMLRRDRENVARGITQAGDTLDTGRDGRAWLTTPGRIAQLVDGQLSIPDALRDRIVAGDDPHLQVLIHQQAEGGPLLVAVSEVTGEDR